MTVISPIRLRPGLDRWLRDRGLGAVDLGKRWGITTQGASRYLLPFDHARRVIPTPTQMADIVSWTAGEITAADFYPPHLNGRPDANAVREAAQ
ncbi:hypothetical protein [Brevundimonas sp.]|uniref:hypothetical protein n=1 Tax=Brevundimonas sp. TaxID=1871086 RepID=UPI002580E633|nr:hypothetical protein [Brevundimonas sp.]